MQVESPLIVAEPQPLAVVEYPRLITPSYEVATPQLAPLRILVTGAAGYIGGFTAEHLLNQGHDVTILDSLEEGHEEAVDKRAHFEQGKLSDEAFLDKVFREGRFDAVIHFAGYISVGESVTNPEKYKKNNVGGTKMILDKMVQYGVSDIVFSSTAAVYGTPQVIPIPEDHPTIPINPYGESKLAVEEMLADYRARYGIGYAALRYFNASGAALDGSRGEAHKHETHLIPNVIKAAQEGKPVTIFGDKFKTPDGTCVRDYVHVLDLAAAHELALAKLKKVSGGDIFNVGTGEGHSNKEVVMLVGQEFGHELEIVFEPKRDGDPAELIAKVDKIRRELGFIARYGMPQIISTAAEWHKRQAKKAA